MIKEELKKKLEEEYDKVIITKANNNNETFAIVEKDKLVGVINERNYLEFPYVIPVAYNIKSICELSKGSKFVIITYHDKYGVIDDRGNLIIPIEYEYIEYYGEDIVTVVKNDLIGVLSAIDGSVIIEIKYNGLKYWESGCFSAKLNNKMGIIDKTGKEIIPIEYKHIEPYSETLFLTINEDDMVGVLDNNNHFILEKCDRVFATKKYIMFEMHKKVGILDSNGTDIIPASTYEDGVLNEDNIFKFRKKFDIPINPSFIDLNTEDKKVMKFQYTILSSDTPECALYFTKYKNNYLVYLEYKEKEHTSIILSYVTDINIKELENNNYCSNEIIDILTLLKIKSPVRK